MSKYLLSYDEADVEAGLLNVTPDGVLKGAGGGSGSFVDIPVVYNESGSQYIPADVSDENVAFIIDALMTRPCRFVEDSYGLRILPINIKPEYDDDGKIVAILAMSFENGMSSGTSTNDFMFLAYIGMKDSFESV